MSEKNPFVLFFHSPDRFKRIELVDGRTYRIIMYSLYCRPLDAVILFIEDKCLSAESSYYVRDNLLLAIITLEIYVLTSRIEFRHREGYCAFCGLPGHKICRIIQGRRKARSADVHFAAGDGGGEVTDREKQNLMGQYSGGDVFFKGPYLWSAEKRVVRPLPLLRQVVTPYPRALVLPTVITFLLCASASICISIFYISYGPRNNQKITRTTEREKNASSYGSTRTQERMKIIGRSYGGFFLPQQWKVSYDNIKRTRGIQIRAYISMYACISISIKEVNVCAVSRFRGKEYSFFFFFFF